MYFRSEHAKNVFIVNEGVCSYLEDVTPCKSFSGKSSPLYFLSVYHCIDFELGGNNNFICIVFFNISKKVLQIIKLKY